MVQGAAPAATATPAAGGVEGKLEQVSMQVHVIPELTALMRAITSGMGMQSCTHVRSHGHLLLERETLHGAVQAESNAADLQVVKAEEPKLAQEAKTELTGAGGAGTAAPAATPAATTAGAFMPSSMHV